MLEIPERAIDFIYDDLHYLSSKKYSLDVGGGLFTNTGNILYSAVDQRWFIIDLQPFITERPGIPKNQTKGFNTPLYLTRGLLPGALCYKDEHAKDPKLIEYRTQLVDRIISGAERNGLNDVGGYLKGNMDTMLNIWELQLRILNVPENTVTTCLTVSVRYVTKKDTGLTKRTSVTFGLPAKACVHDILPYKTGTPVLYIQLTKYIC